MMAEKTTKSEILNYVNFLLCVLLSFGGAFFTLAEIGEIRTLFIVILFAFLNSFVNTKLRYKLVFFGVFGYILHSFYGEGFYESLVCAFFCVGLMCLVQLSVSIIKTKKAVGIIAVIGVIMLSASVHVFLFGSPFSAFGAKDTINEYIDKSYIGEAIEKSEVRYDRHLGRFVCDINSISEPTEIFTVSLKNGKIEDTFRDHVEISLMNGKRLEIVNSLRESFPNESFSVVCNSIQNFHFVKAGITDGEDRSGEMVFDVYISAYLTPADFISKAESYTKALEDKGIKYSKINFYGGRAGKYYRRLTLLCSDLPQNTKIEFVPHCFADLLASRLIRYDLPGTEIK